MIAPRSDASTTADDAAHYDDILSYTTTAELISRAKLNARTWPVAPIVLDQATVSGVAVAGFDPAVTQDTGRSSFTIGGVTISASSSLGTQNIGFRERDGVGGIGVLPGGSTSGGSLSSTNAETLRLNFGIGSEFRKVDIAFNEFRNRSDASSIRERVQISLWRNGVPLQISTMNSWMSDALVGATNCLFEVVPGNEFDMIEIVPLARTVDGGSTSLTIASFKACSAAMSSASCTTTITGSIPCPARSPGAGTSIATNVSVNAATFNGIVNANGASTTVSFDYGPTNLYGASIGATPASVTGSNDTAVLANPTGLTCNTTYHYRASAASAGGSTLGNDSMFNTAPCP